MKSALLVGSTLVAASVTLPLTGCGHDDPSPAQTSPAASDDSSLTSTSPAGDPNSTYWNDHDYRTVLAENMPTVP